MLRDIFTNDKWINPVVRSFKKKDFVQHILSTYKKTFAVTAMYRTIIWRIGEVRYQSGLKNGLTYDEIKKECKYEDPQVHKISKTLGIKSTSKDWEGLFTDLTEDKVMDPANLPNIYHAVRPERYVHFIDSGIPEKPYVCINDLSHLHLPSGSNGAEDFHLSHRYNAEELGIIHDRVIAAMNFFKRYKKTVVPGSTAVPSLHRIQMSEIYAVMNKAVPPQMAAKPLTPGVI